MGRMRKIYRKYAAVLSQAARSRLAYPKEILGNAVFLAVLLFVYNALWTKVLSGRGIFAGFSHAQLIWYLAFTESMTFAFPRIQNMVNEDVKTGNIAYRLNRPAHYLGLLLAEYLGETLAKAVPVFTAGAGMAALLVGGLPGFTPLHLLLAGTALILGVLLSFCCTVSLAMTAFWLEDNGPYFWIYQKINFILGGLLLPVEVYPGLLRRIAEFLPFRLVYAGAARLGVKFEAAMLASTLAGQICWLLPLAVATLFIYRRGVRKLNVNGG